MQLHPIFADEIARIQVDVARSYIEIEWFGHPDSETFRAIIMRAHVFAQAQQLTKWLCNMQRAEFLELADQHWLVQEIFPAFNPQLQHEYAYFIQPLVLEVLATYHIQDMVEVDERLKEKIKVAVFTDVDQAQQWLFNPMHHCLSEC